VTLMITDQQRAAISGLLDFPVIAAINGRRSRRFPVGGTIPSGELQFSSSKPMQPLSEVERALVLTTVTGVTLELRHLGTTRVLIYVRRRLGRRGSPLVPRRGEGWSCGRQL
jgi:hypothetical protein